MRRGVLTHRVEEVKFSERRRGPDWGLSTLGDLEPTGYGTSRVSVDSRTVDPLTK